MNQVFDIAIIGGGINGCGCAADAALRGLSVVLFEKDDLASKTSSSSTKLIHGGLRYLENYEFGLVKKALDERQTLINLAPHLVHPQPFVLPYHKQLRPAWLLRLGLFIYDYLSRKNHLPKSKSIHKNRHSAYFSPLINKFKHGFLFYDASTDDSRLTICNALQAKNHGASIRPHTTLIEAHHANNFWKLTVQSKTGDIYSVFAKTIINAAGPWVEAIAKIIQIPEQQKITLIKGSHIVVPKFYEGKHAYFLQHDDKRIVFVIPYHQHIMIGTTDVPFTGSPEKVNISDEEIDYLTEIVNSYFKIKIKREDILFSWSGLRPLIAHKDTEPRSLSRDYYYELSSNPAPVVTIYSGKITTYRQMAEKIINQLEPFFPNMKQSKTKYIPLPGANLEHMDFNHYVTYAKEKYKWLDHELLNRYLFSYGTRTEQFLSQCNSIESMGKKFGSWLYQVEVDYLVMEEWAKDCEDILQRRTKLGLSMDDESKKELENYLGTCTITSADQYL